MPATHPWSLRLESGAVKGTIQFSIAFSVIRAYDRKKRSYTWGVS